MARPPERDRACPFCGALIWSIVRHCYRCPKWPQNPTPEDHALIKAWPNNRQERRAMLTHEELDKLLDGDRLVTKRDSLVTFKGWTGFRGVTVAVLQDDYGQFYVESESDMVDLRASSLTRLDLDRRLA